ncbi:MAG TPA: ATP-binding cassette domain-containing protein [Gemmatales bacterium]|nr:ATP-binding cassette domain-containing protein [Gemmatales bacterium]
MTSAAHPGHHAAPSFLIQGDEHSHHDGALHEHHHGPPPLRRLLGLLRPEWRDIFIVVIYALGIGVLSLATPITAAALVNNVAFGIMLQPLIVLCIVLAICLFAAAMIRLAKHFVVEGLQQRLFARVVADLAWRLPRVRATAFDRQHGPELVNRFFDVLTVQKSAATLLIDGVSLVLQATAGLLLLAWYHHLLLAFDILLVGVLLFILFGLGRGAVQSAIAQSRAKYAVASWIEEMARHPLAFKLAGGADLALQRADAVAQNWLQARRAHFRIVMRQFTGGLMLQLIASVLLLGLGGWLVINQQLSLGQLVAAEIIVTLVVSSFSKFGKQLEAFYDLLAAVDKLGHMFSLPLERSTGTLVPARSGPAAVSIQNVSFMYDGSQRPVLNGFSLNVAPGERVAILGPNGAGKSTLIDLIVGLRTPLQGFVEFNGVDVRDFALESLRLQVGTVKNIEIFEGSILENVRMARADVDLEEVRRALYEVGLLADVLDLPDGLGTQLWTGGVPLSLGQAQRLMLARAIVGHPRLLILDEVLDDMDRELRDEVLPAILRRDAPWTLLVVTHSHEVARLCDRQVEVTKHRRGGRDQAPGNGQSGGQSHDRRHS